MKIAHLILVHKSPEQLVRLVEALTHPAFIFFIHVDKKFDDAPFKTALQRPDVFFIEKRTKIYWGDWGTIQATINGFEIILPKGYDYINVISGQDFPIKPAEDIYRYIAERKGQEFITCDTLEGNWKDAASRITDYHLINWRVPGKHRLEKVITKVLPKRKFPLPYQLVGRANWFTLSADAAKYSLDFLLNHPKVVRYFKYCWGADEFIFSTILYNSPFREKILDNLVYVDWNGPHLGHPKVLATEDFDALKCSEKLFARKFDLDKSAEIFALLEDCLLQQSAIGEKPASNYKDDVVVKHV
jgi:hypothetical protein